MRMNNNQAGSDSKRKTLTAVSIIVFVLFSIAIKGLWYQDKTADEPEKSTVVTATVEELSKAEVSDELMEEATESEASDETKETVIAETDAEKSLVVVTEAETLEVIPDTKTYTFKNANLKNEHYEKHGVEMGFASADEYEAAASAVVNNPAALHKLEAEDGDDVYYIEATNEFVIVSTRGYIRTYFKPNSGKAYYDRQ